MSFQFDFDSEALSFGTVRIRAKILWIDTPVKLKPAIQVDVGKGSGYEGKVLIKNAELIDDQKRYRFIVDLKEGSFSLSEYKALIMGQKPLPLLVTLYPDISLPIPTAGVPLPSVSLPISDYVSIDMPKTVIGLIDAEQDISLPFNGDTFRIKARVYLPQILKERDALEKKYTAALAFSPKSEMAKVGGTFLSDDKKMADIISTKKSLSLQEPVKVTIRISSDIEGIILERDVEAELNPLRRLELYLSKDFLQTSMEKPEDLLIRAVDVLESGKRVPAGDAQIEVRASEEISRVAEVQPTSGTEHLVTQVTQKSIPDVKESLLSVEAGVPEGSIEKTVPILFDIGKYSLKCEPKGKESPFLIHWNKVEWVCDPVTVTVLVNGKVRKDVEISEIRMSDEKGWLKLEDMEKTGLSEYTIRLKIEPESGAAIAPQTGEELEVQDYSQRDESSLKECPPATPLFSLVTFTASISSKLPLKPSADAAKAAMSAAGLIPLPDSAIPSPDLNFTEASGECYAIVEPPLFTWTISQQDPVRISGEPKKTSVMKVRAEHVPRGWDRGTVVGFCFDEPEFREKSGLRLQPKIESLSSSSSDPFFQITCVLEVESTILGLTQVEDVKEVMHPVPESEPFKVVTEGEMIGRAVQILNVNVQPCPVSLYLDTFPVLSYPWDDEKYKIQARKVANTATSDWSKLPVEIWYDPEGWIEPPVKWIPNNEESKEYEDDEELIPKNEELKKYDNYDDYFTPSSGLQSTYIAPSQGKWAAGSKDGIGSPQRPVRCVIGQSPKNGKQPVSMDTKSDPKNGKQPVPMDSQRGIFSTLHIDTEFTIRKPLGNVPVHITVKPDGFPASPEEMDLVDGKIYESIVRTFCIEIDLQTLPVHGREEK